MDLRHSINGIPLLQNSFYFYDTMGLPLNMQMDMAHENGCMVSLLDFMQDAIRAGWSVEKAKKVVDAACIDVFGKIPKGIF